MLEEEALFPGLSWNVDRLALGGVLCVVDERIRQARQVKGGQDLRRKADFAAKNLVQVHYPGRSPRYCSDPCEDEGRREKTRERVKKLRARQRMMQEQETELSSQDET